MITKLVPRNQEEADNIMKGIRVLITTALILTVILIAGHYFF